MTQSQTEPHPAPARAAEDALSQFYAPWEQMAAGSAAFTEAKSFDGPGAVGGDLRRYTFAGPGPSSGSIRVGLFGAIHGDEPAGAYALRHLAGLLDREPELARDFTLLFFPVCNPTGFEDHTRHSRRDVDLNRQFWIDSSEPEIEWLQGNLRGIALQGIIALHADDTSDGVYGFARGALITRHLLKPALSAAEEILPRNGNPVIDGFKAREGLIRSGYPGMLSAPPGVKPRPFEITLETPATAPFHLQERALVVAMLTILAEYRKFIAYAADI